MPFIKGPNGVELNVSEDLAAALLVNEGYEIVEPVIKKKPASKKSDD